MHVETRAYLHGDAAAALVLDPFSVEAEGRGTSRQRLTKGPHVISNHVVPLGNLSICSIEERHVLDDRLPT